MAGTQKRSRRNWFLNLVPSDDIARLGAAPRIRRRAYRNLPQRQRLRAAVPTSSDVSRPSWRKLLAEAPALVRLFAAQLKKPHVAQSAEQGRPVMVIPAFLANDLPTSLLRRTLEASGHSAHGWSQGFNLGARASKFERLLRLIDGIHRNSQSRLVLIGWSLGGLYARELAKRRPEKVSMVITLGTPFSQSLRHNNAWKLYEAINDHDVDHPPIPVQPNEKPSVRTIAMWSRRDGIVAPASASGQGQEVDESIELHCRHNEMVSDPEALEAILRALQPAA
jgi:dienelactone hydrolase